MLRRNYGVLKKRKKKEKKKKKTGQAFFYNLHQGSKATPSPVSRILQSLNIGSIPNFVLMVLGFLARCLLGSVISRLISWILIFEGTLVPSSTF